MFTEELPYRIALTMVDGVGPSLAKNLISYCGSAQGVFAEKKSFLTKIPGIGELTAMNIGSPAIFRQVEKEIKLMEKHRIKPVYYLDKEYPLRLKHYEDCPVLVYYKGPAGLNHQRMVSIVGTRKSSVQGRQFTEELILALKPFDVMVVSGLASGTDTNAHKYCVKNGLRTIGVLGHGFHTMYPVSNRQLAEDMLKEGGLLTEFPFMMPGNKENFPRRNRIVAGMSDATIVIESGIKGGSLITAEIANQYSKEVFALPGRIGDPQSQGCNQLIHDNKAGIIHSIPGLMKDLGYEIQKPRKDAQLSLPTNLSAQELAIFEYLQTGEKGIDDIHFYTRIHVSKLALILLDLEFRNLVRAMPGKTYALQMANA